MENPPKNTSGCSRRRKRLKGAYFIKCETFVKDPQTGKLQRSHVPTIRL